MEESVLDAPLHAEMVSARTSQITADRDALINTIQPPTTNLAERNGREAGSEHPREPGRTWSQTRKNGSACTHSPPKMRYGRC